MPNKPDRERLIFISRERLGNLCSFEIILADLVIR